MEIAGGYRLPRRARLQRSSEFELVRRDGSRVAQGCLIVNWLPLPENSRSRLGVVVGRKIGCAVARSRARRLLREVFRRHQHEFVRPVDMVLVARPSINEKRFAEVDRDFLAAITEAGILRRVV